MRRESLAGWPSEQEIAGLLLLIGLAVCCYRIHQSNVAGQHDRTLGSFAEIVPVRLYRMFVAFDGEANLETGTARGKRKSARSREQIDAVQGFLEFFFRLFIRSHGNRF